MPREKPSNTGAGHKGPGNGNKPADGKDKPNGLEWGPGIRNLGLGKKSADEKLNFLINELLEIKQQVSKLDSIQASTDTLAKKLSGVTARTTELETAVTTNTARLREVNDQLSTLETAVKKQEGNITTIVQLKHEISKSSAKTITQMNQLVDTQGQQVQSFKSSKKMVKKEIMKEVDKKIDKIREEERCRAFKKEAFKNRLNLIIVGLKEEENKSALVQAADFFKNALQIKDLEITTAHRIGSKSEDDSHYARPIWVKLKKLC